MLPNQNTLAINITRFRLMSTGIVMGWINIR